MGKSTEAAWPDFFWNVLAAAEQHESFVVSMPAKNIATNMRHRFHNFRREMIKQRFPGATAMSNLTVSIKETADQGLVLHFFYFEIDVPGLPQPQATKQGRAPDVATKAAKPTRDAAEDLVSNMYNIKLKEQQACKDGGEHDWDEQYGICRRCQAERP